MYITRLNHKKKNENIAKEHYCSFKSKLCGRCGIGREDENN